MIIHDQLFIGTRWVAPAGAEFIDVISPSTEQVIGRVPKATPADMDAAVAAARKAFDHGPWPRMAVAERIAIMEQVLDRLRQRKDEFVALLTSEVGVPISACPVIQVDQPLETLAYFIDLGRKFEFEEVRTGKRESIVVREPVGVVAAIVPWNAPLRSIMNKLAPALICGCTIVIKPSPENPLHSYLLADCLMEAGIPEGVVSILAGDAVAGEHLVRHPRIDKVAFTGSTVAGRRIMAACAERLTRVSLELGGKSAAIVLDDITPIEVVSRLSPLIFGNNGQACTAQSRVLVSRRLHDGLVEALCVKVGSFQVGDPFDPKTDIGPLVSARQRERVESYFKLAREEGAVAVIGGGRPAHLTRGWYVEPTVLINASNAMRVAREEIFGPVATVIPYDSVDEAIAMANDSDYGLSGSVWTADVERGIDIARRVRTGTFTINGAMQSPDAPFGGFKQSGIGREYGFEGMHEYLEIKSIALRRR